MSDYQSIVQGSIATLDSINSDCNSLAASHDTENYANEGTHYWNYAAVGNNDMTYNKEDFHIKGELTIEDAGLRKSMKEALEKDGIKVEEFSDGRLRVIWG